MGRGPNLSKLPDTERILNRILYMISKDVFACEKIQSKKEVRWACLDSETASKLVNYARALKGIIEVQGSQHKKAKKMTDEQLNKAVLELHQAEISKIEEIAKGLVRE